VFILSFLVYAIYIHIYIYIYTHTLTHIAYKHMSRIWYRRHGLREPSDRMALQSALYIMPLASVEFPSSLSHAWTHVSSWTQVFTAMFSALPYTKKPSSLQYRVSDSTILYQFLQAIPLSTNINKCRIRFNVRLWICASEESVILTIKYIYTYM